MSTYRALKLMEVFFSGKRRYVVGCRGREMNSWMGGCARGIIVPDFWEPGR